MGHRILNHNKASEVRLSDYKVGGFAEDDYFDKFQPNQHKLFKKYSVSKLPRLRLKRW